MVMPRMRFSQILTMKKTDVTSPIFLCVSCDLICYQFILVEKVNSAADLSDPSYQHRSRGLRCQWWASYDAVHSRLLLGLGCLLNQSLFLSCLLVGRVTGFLLGADAASFFCSFLLADLPREVSLTNESGHFVDAIFVVVANVILLHITVVIAAVTALRDVAVRMFEWRAAWSKNPSPKNIFNVRVLWDNGRVDVLNGKCV